MESLDSFFLVFLKPKTKIVKSTGLEPKVWDLRNLTRQIQQDDFFALFGLITTGGFLLFVIPNL
jgi:hypothetical protein